MKTTTKKVELIAHTTCGLEFEIIEVETGKSLTGGRIFWCDDEEMEYRDSDGIEHFTAKIAEKGWELIGVAWS